jgi:hypothetical protein
VVVDTRWRARVITVQNIAARARGTGGGKPILLMAHYDSRSMTPGASDDGYGVVTLLETARAMKSWPSGPSDVIFLFTDAEELGLLGARAFIEEHPWAQDVGVVLNFEARGNRGPALMFQTSRGAGGLVRALASTSSPSASSLAQAVYERMPNDTDLTEWLARGVPAMNFGNIDGLDRYHSATDDVASADLSTIQHHGESATGVLRYLQDKGVPGPQADLTYFNLGPFFVRYPLSLGPVLAALGALWSLGLAILAVRRGQATPVGIAAGIGIGLVVLVVATLAGAAGYLLLDAIHPEYGQAIASATALKTLSFATACFLALAGAVAIHSALRAPIAHLILGSFALGSLLTFAVAYLLPGGAYLFVVPLLFTAAAATPLAWTNRWEDERLFPLHALAAMGALLVLFPVTRTVAITFDIASAPAVGLLVGVTAVFSAPAVRLLARPRPVRMAVALTGVVLLVATHLTPARPRPYTLVYAVNHDAGKAMWITPDREGLPGALETPLPDLFPLERSRLRSQEAPVESIEAPRLVVMGDDRSGRTLHLRAFAPPGAELMALYVDRPVRAVRAQGKIIPAASKLVLYCSAPPAAGIDISLDVESGPVRARLVAQIPGLPAVRPPRAADRVPKPGTLPPWDELLESDMTLSSKSFDL